MFQPKIPTVSEQPQKVSSVFSAGHEKDFLYPRIHKRLDGVIDHRLVIDGKQMLVCHSGYWKESASCSPGKYNTLHISLLRVDHSSSSVCLDRWNVCNRADFDVAC